MSDEMITFTIGDAAICVANLDDGLACNPLERCRRLGRCGKHGSRYEGARPDVLALLDEIEGCPAYSPQGEGGGGEGFGGDYIEVAAVRRASDSIRKALGLPLRGWRRTVQRRRRA